MAVFVLRRNWLRLAIWLVVLTGMIPLTYASLSSTFPTARSREAYAAIANTPSVAALTGMPYAANTLGGIVVLKILMTVGVTLAFATVFLITRNGRAEEEEGRTELLRSGVLGPHAYSAANYRVVGVFAVAVGVMTATVAAALGLPLRGSIVMGASLTGLALFFLGVAAVCGQLASTSRAANGFATAAIGVAYVIRAIGDLTGVGDRASGISWASPIGWFQQMRPYGDDSFWPFFLLLAGAGILVAIAVWLEGRRDLGAALVAERSGPARASAFMSTPFGLALRLQRGSIIGWVGATIVMAALYGSVANSMANLLASNATFTAVLGGHSASITNGVIGLLVIFNAIVATAFAIQSVLQIRGEEASGRAELQLAGNISRLRWAGGRLLVAVVGSLGLLVIGGVVMGGTYGLSQSDGSQIWALLGDSVLYWPGVLLSAGIAVLLIGILPRLASAASWGYFGVVVLITTFGDVFGLPSWLTEHTPLSATPRLPADSFEIVPVLILSGIAVVLWVGGLYAFARRDLSEGA
ncbi:exporter of polyketide antibiotics [soil metagenome]